MSSSLAPQNSSTSFQSLLGLIFIFTTLSFYVQWPGLYGPNGLLPVTAGRVCPAPGSSPTLFDQPLVCLFDQLGISFDGMTELILVSTMIVALFTALAGSLGSNHLFVWYFVILWLGYNTIVSMGGAFTTFQWDILLLETVFLSIFAGSSATWLSHLNYCYRFLAFKLMFLSGIVKLQARCPTWEQLTALEFHFATQCLPTPFAWFAHQMPPFILRLSVGITLLIEIPYALMLICPVRLVRRIGAALQILLQVVILLTGNYNFFNILTLALMMKVWEDDSILLDTSRSPSNIYAKSKIPKKPSSPSRYSISLSDDGDDLDDDDGVDDDNDFVMEMEVRGPLAMVVDAQHTFWGKAGIWAITVSYLAYWWGVFLEIEPDWSDGWTSLVAYSKVRLVTSLPALQPSIELACLAALFVSCLCVALGAVQHSYSIATSGAYSHHTRKFLRVLLLIAVSFLALSWLVVASIPLTTVANLAPYVPMRALRFFQEYAQPMRLVSGYGLFRSMTGVAPIEANPWGGVPPSRVARPEVILEGLPSNSEKWVEIPFRFKPGRLDLMPALAAPHQPRLDWQMWFAALGRIEHNPWLVSLVNRLLSDQPHPEVLDLLGSRQYPFRDAGPPRAIRATLYDYDFTRWNHSWAKDVAVYAESYVESGASGRWWVRRAKREYLPPVELGNESIEQYLKAQGIEHPKRHVSHWEQYQECLEYRSPGGAEVRMWLKSVLCAPLYARNWYARLNT